MGARRLGPAPSAGLTAVGHALGRGGGVGLGVGGTRAVSSGGNRRSQWNSDDGFHRAEAIGPTLKVISKSA